MPARVKPPPINKEQKILLENIDVLSKRCGITRAELCNVLGIKQNAYYDRLKEPGKFRFEELLRFAKRANIPIEKLFMERKWSA